MPRKPKLGISKDEFIRNSSNRIDLCGIGFRRNPSDDLDVYLSATNHDWRIDNQHPHTNNGVRIHATPTRKRDAKVNGEDDLTVTIVVNGDMTDPVVITYDDILYNDLFDEENSSSRPAKNKKLTTKKVANKKPTKKKATKKKATKKAKKK